MTPSKPQRPPFFRLLLEGCKLSWELAPRCLAVIIPFFALSSGLQLFCNWLLMGETNPTAPAVADLGFGAVVAGALSNALVMLGFATIAWITVRRIEGETPSPVDAFRRLGQMWGTVFAAGVMSALLSFASQMIFWKKGYGFLTSIDAYFLRITFVLLMSIVAVLWAFYFLRMAFVATVPMVEGSDLIDSVKRSNFLIKGSTVYMLLLMVFMTLLFFPPVLITFFFNSNFFEVLKAGTHEVAVETGSPYSLVGILAILLTLVAGIYSTVTTAALYQHLRKLKSA